MLSLRNTRPVMALALLLLMLVLILSGWRYAAAGENLQQADPAGLPDPVLYLPLILKPSVKPLPPPIPYSTAPPLDVQALAASIPEPWQLGLNKIGFHTGISGNRVGIDMWMEKLDSAGIPIFIKSADDAGPIYDAQEIAKVSGVPHTLVFRTTAAGRNDGYDYDVPNYGLPPDEAALIHWQAHKAKFPPELDPQYVWFETINEIDKTHSEWLADFALETGRLALKDGYKWAAFGWSSGEPEPEHWESPRMLEFLRFAAQHPDDIAIALHEYSYEVDDIGNIYPYLIGRFQTLFDVCDKYGIPRPTVLITEWGWVYNHVPEPADALADMHWANQLYAAYPTVKGAATWYLGKGSDRIHDDTQKLIIPVTDYSLSNYFWVASGQGGIDTTLFQPPPPQPDLLEEPDMGPVRLTKMRPIWPPAFRVTR